MKKALPLCLLISLGLIWGSGYSIARYAMTNGVPAAGYTFWQSLGPAIILSLLSLKKFNFDKQHITFFIVCGLIGIAIPNTNMYFASRHLPAGLLAVIVNTVPIIIYPLALITRQERFHWLRLIGVFLAIVGVVSLSLKRATLPEAHNAHWIVLALITPLCFAIFALFINPQRPANSDPLSLAAGMLIAATLILMPFVYATHSFYPLHWPLLMPDKIILLEIVLSSIGYVLFFWLLKIAGPVYYSLTDGVVALTGLAWGKLIFGESFHGITFIAISLIVVGVLFVTLHQKSVVDVRNNN